MRSSNPIEFGLHCSWAYPFPRTLELVHAAEEAGFDIVAFRDSPPEASLEAWTLATAIGALTSRIRLTHAALVTSYRNPALVAKMAATLDHVTGGRVILTLGAGNREAHHQAFGYDYGTADDRVTNVRDAVAIMRGLWSGEPFTYEGRHFRVQDATAPPRPIVGSIPIHVAATNPRMLRLTGAIADGWLKGGGHVLKSMDELRGLVDQVEAGAVRAGRDPRTIRRVLTVNGYVGERTPDQLAPAFRGGIAPPGWHQNVGGIGKLVGPPERIREIIDEHAEAGVDCFLLNLGEEDLDTQIRRFGTEVITPLAA